MILWLCEDVMIGRQEHSGFPNLADAAEAAGHASVVGPWDSLQPDHLPDFDIAVAWGARRFVAHCREIVPVDKQGGFFDASAAQRYDFYGPRLAPNLLNAAHTTMEWEKAVSDPRIESSGLFIKPAIHSKRFTGFVLRADNRARTLAELSHVEPDTPCIVAAPCPNILAESRHVIIDRRVVASSTYRWGDRLDVRRDTYPQAEALAQWVAEQDWQADGAYVCDVALLDDRQTTKIVELNPFSSSGLYACDTTAIVAAMDQLLRTRHES